VPFAPSRKPARTRGQTIVEFALTLPVLILLLLFAIDFGRVFLGWISLNNAARVGANYAAMHPHDWDSGSGPAEYDTLMADKGSSIHVPTHISSAPDNRTCQATDNSSVDAGGVTVALCERTPEPRTFNRT